MNDMTDWLNEWVNEWMNEWHDMTWHDRTWNDMNQKRMNEWMNEWHESMNQKMDEWTNENTDMSEIHEMNDCLFKILEKRKRIKTRKRKNQKNRETKTSQDSEDNAVEANTRNSPFSSQSWMGAIRGSKLECASMHQQPEVQDRKRSSERCCCKREVSWYPPEPQKNGKKQSHKRDN